MNWVLVGVIVVLGLNAYFGLKKGMVRIILSLAAMIATILITMALTPIASSFIKDNTNWYTNIKNATYQTMQRNNTVDDAFQEMGKTQDITKITDINQSSTSMQNVSSQVIDKLKVPESLKNQIQSKINIEKYVGQGITTVEDMVANALAEQVSLIIFNILVFAGIFIVVYIIMQVIIRVVDIVSRLPVLKQINKTGGLVLGLAKGLIVVWVFFIAITIFCDTEFAHTVFAYVNSNSFLAFLYNNNLILKLIFAII
ncbi:CvpA family protein [[Clostridium] fimetarium]|uniref:Colicin V production protein n=1 Tax=[Clostridium] fimetarium TaxID=99656 RepID=A0A1I0RE98_9FIRM|nr:CvpA family protein [[Clostridium] fimetarium]SEW38568.1 Colicin V production protein [[Clostridium] fimetarium]